jgi:hypothetical protein
MKIYFKSFFLFAAIAVSFSSCYYDSLEELHPAPIIIPGINDSTSTGCDTINAITYTANIKPILDPIVELEIVATMDAGSSKWYRPKYLLRSQRCSTR